MLFGTGCTKWLDVPDPSKNKEPDVYKSELGINNVLNGLYRTLVSDDLYGDKLSADVLDASAHYYVYPSSYSSAYSLRMQSLFYISTYDYNNRDIRGTYDVVWKKGYNYILQVNAFIANMESLENKGVLSEDRRKLYLGEAYGLRAFMHLDLYRLYGPVSAAGEEGVLPYHKNPVIETPDYLSPSAFLVALTEDLTKANDLLKATDPIVLDEKVHDGASEDNDLSSEDKFAKMFRNKRMNYWAVQMLKMRVLMLQGKNAEVVSLGNTMLTEAVDPDFAGRTGSFSGEWLQKSGAPFGWTGSGNDWVNNAVLYDEVVFGATQLTMNSWWKRHFEQSNADGSTRLILEKTLTQVIAGAAAGTKFDLATNSTTLFDYRLKQYDKSLITAGSINSNGGQDNYFMSKKYKSDKLSEDTSEGRLYFYVKNLRCLLRLSEVEYMVAEANLNLDNVPDAIVAVNNVLQKRGYKASVTYNKASLLPANATKANVVEMLRLEYYREFPLEGQVFHFLKRNKLPAIDGTSANDTQLTEGNYVWVRPQGEQDFD